MSTEDIPVEETAVGERPLSRPSDQPRRRRCLRCAEDFPSAWSGERICPGCKRSALWRAGLPFRPRSSHRRA